MPSDVAAALKMQLLDGGFVSSFTVLSDQPRRLVVEVVAEPIWNEDLTEVRSGAFAYLAQLVDEERAATLRGESLEKWRAKGNSVTCRQWDVVLVRANPPVHLTLRLPTRTWGADR